MCIVAQLVGNGWLLATRRVTTTTTARNARKPWRQDKWPNTGRSTASGLYHCDACIRSFHPHCSHVLRSTLAEGDTQLTNVQSPWKCDVCRSTRQSISFHDEDPVVVHTGRPSPEARDNPESPCRSSPPPNRTTTRRTRPPIGRSLPTKPTTKPSERALGERLFQIHFKWV